LVTRQGWISSVEFHCELEVAQGIHVLWNSAYWGKKLVQCKWKYYGTSTEWVGVKVMLKSHIWEVYGSNLGEDTDYPHWGFLCLFSIPQANAEVVPWSCHNHLHQIVSNSSFTCSYHSMPYSPHTDSVFRQPATKRIGLLAYVDQILQTPVVNPQINLQAAVDTL
jgi:hypothetical protein